MPPSAVPITLYYVALFGALGMYLPYLSLYLSSTGLSEAAAVQVQAAGPVVNLIVPPLLGLLADARRARVWMLRGFSALAALMFAALGAVGGNLPAIVAVFALFSVARAPLVPLADATTHEHVRHHGGTYGRLRTWGSLGYLVAAFGAGRLYDATTIGAMIWATTIALALSVACAWRMPAPAPRKEAGLLRSYRALLARRELWWFLLAVAAGQAANSCYDSTLSLHLRHLGYGKDFLGLVIAVGVAAETALLALSGRILARLGAERALALAFAVAAVRWLLLSMVTSPLALVAQAPLHAVTFGLYWVTATTLMREYAGQRAATAGQGLLGAATAVGMFLGLSIGGALLAQGGGHLLYLCASGVSAVAALVATVHAVQARRAARLAHPAPGDR